MTSTNDLPHKKPDRAAISPIKFDPQKKRACSDLVRIFSPPTASTHLLQIHFAAQKKEELHF